MSAQLNLTDLLNRIATNTLTPGQQAALGDALTAIIPSFPTPDDLADSIPQPEEALAREWMASLYTIALGPGGTPLPPVVADVTGTAPIVVTPLPGSVRNVSITPATALAAGSMSAADFAKLAALAPGDVTAVTASFPLASTGGATPNIAPSTGFTLTGSVATGALLTALSVVGLPVGTEALVATYGAYFSLQPVAPLIPDVVLASSNAGFIWQRTTSAIADTWTTQTDIFWDPVAGNNEAAGTAIGTPVKNFSEIVRRYGTMEPQLPYGQSVTIHKLSAQAPNTDAVFFLPKLSGGGKAILVDTLVVKTVAFVGGAVTAKNQATGTRLAVAGFPAGTAAGDYVFNQTRNSYANVDVGGVTPIFSQPLPAATVTTPGVPALAEDNTWTAGDTYIVFTRNLLNLGSWRGRGADATAGGSLSSGWVQWSQISDSSGTGASVYEHSNFTGANTLSGCRVLPRVHMSALGGRGFGVYLLGCDCAQAILTFGSNTMMYGSISRNSFQPLSGVTTVDGGTILHGATQASCSNLQLADVFSDGTISTTNGAVTRMANSNGGVTALWGTCSVDCQAGSAFLAPATFATQVKTSGAFTLSSVATGSAYVGAGVMTDGIALTIASIDAGGAGGGGLFNPRTGARFVSGV